MHERLKQPLVVTDDDVAGTFTFVRALEDYGISADLSAEEIGKAWLNYIVEERSILWWGGNGISTEHTAWLNLKRGRRGAGLGLDRDQRRRRSPSRSARRSSSTAGRWWRRASRSSRRGWRSRPARSAMTASRCYAAMLWAAMEAEAFGSADIDHLLDTGLAQIPRDSLIARLIADVRALAQGGPGLARHARSGSRRTTATTSIRGNCHVVPNHALMVMAVLYAPRRLPEGADDRQHLGLGHRLQCRQCRLPARHHERARRARRGARLARADRRPDADLVGRRRQLDQRRGARRPTISPISGCSWPAAQGLAAPKAARSSISRCRAAGRVSGRSEAGRRSAHRQR